MWVRSQFILLERNYVEIVRVKLVYLQLKEKSVSNAYKGSGMRLMKRSLIKCCYLWFHTRNLQWIKQKNSTAIIFYAL